MPAWPGGDGYETPDPPTGQFSLSEEQMVCLADPNGLDISAAFLIVLGYLRAEPFLATRT